MVLRAATMRCSRGAGDFVTRFRRMSRCVGNYCNVARQVLQRGRPEQRIGRANKQVNAAGLSFESTSP
jgi:hypothetical protein